VVGIVNAMWIGVMSRKREIALWRSIGVTRIQISRIVIFEGLFIGIVAAALGTVGGLYGGWLPLRSFSFAVTGYLYPRVVPWVHVFEVIALALVLGAMAGMAPAREAAKLPILESIGYE
jgi:putative ABC transport system permease protein